MKYILWLIFILNLATVEAEISMLIHLCFADGINILFRTTDNRSIPSKMTYNALNLAKMRGQKAIFDF